MKRHLPTCAEEIFEVACDLERAGDVPFTPEQVLALLRRRGSRHKDSTIRTHVSAAMCREAPDNHGLTDRPLSRVGRGLYRLASAVDTGVAARTTRD